MRKPWNWLSFFVGLAGALVVLGGTWIGIALFGIAQANEQAEFEACMAALGFTRDAPGDDLEALIAASEVCGR